jgi:capsular exopolysaccharide synthesis family protein
MDGKINIKALLKKLVSKWYYFLITLLLIMPLAYLFNEYADREYLVRGSILLNGDVKNGIDNEKFLKGMELFTSHTAIEDEIGILKSYQLVERTIRRLDFGVSYFEKKNFKMYENYENENYPFYIELDSTVNQVINVPVYIHRTSENTYRVAVSGKEAETYNFYTNRMTEKVFKIQVNADLPNETAYSGENLGFKVKFTVPYDAGTKSEYYFVINNLASVAEGYREKLDVKPISRESNIVEITLKAKSPQKDIKFLNTLLDVYLENELNKKNQLGLKTIQFIDDQLSGVSDELKQVEGSLESFRSRNNILDITTTAENLTRNLDKVETDKSILELKLKYYKYIAGALDNGKDVKNIGAPSTFGLEDPLLNNLLLELSRLNQERAGLNYTTREGNPVVEVIDAKIANHKKTLVDNVNNFIEASTIALDDLNAKTNQIKRNVQGLPRSEREMVSIQRRFDFNDNVYNYLLEKKAEAGIAIASNTVEKTVVDKAKQIGGGPVFPNRKIIFLVAFVLAIGISLVLMIFRDLFNDHIITTEDVEKSTRIPFIGAIAHGSKREKATGIVANAKSVLGESFRSLRVNLQYLTLGKENNVIGITSSKESEGKTFCSSNLAVAMAQSGRRTIIIDADLRRPRVAAAFQLKNDKGLSSYLIGNCTVAEIINTTNVKGLDVITSGPIPPNPLDLIGLPKMEALINGLKQVYNTIIIDSSPIGYVSEYIILMKYTNANIYVVRSNYTNRFQLEKINKLYEDKKIKNVSILLNDARMSVNGYNSYVYK